jgi:hypothetical protein
MVTVNVDLKRERSGASFDAEALTHVWNGGESRTRRRRYLGFCLFLFRQLTSVTAGYFVL